MSRDQRIVILADTHTGDRTPVLDAALLRAVEAEQPDRIFHAGDVCKPEVIERLSQIAPTNAVQGNFGISLRLGRPVSTLLIERLPALSVGEKMAIARSAAPESVVKKGLPVPAAKIAMRPFSRWRMARRRM